MISKGVSKLVAVKRKVSGVSPQVLLVLNCFVALLRTLILQKKTTNPTKSTPRFRQSTAATVYAA